MRLDAAPAAARRLSTAAIRAFTTTTAEASHWGGLASGGPGSAVWQVLSCSHVVTYHTGGTRTHTSQQRELPNTALVPLPLKLQTALFSLIHTSEGPSQPDAAGGARSGAGHSGPPGRRAVPRLVLRAWLVRRLDDGAVVSRALRLRAALLGRRLRHEGDKSLQPGERGGAQRGLARAARCRLRRRPPRTVVRRVHRPAGRSGWRRAARVLRRRLP
eukprot:1455114-Prymnesium_polylepis.1